ncbi:hypothetical protein CDAR_396771 [Caerostris darwini]|uniref:Uncharacterized protein n=1 Tax=Caerostris darwini TaxID=1538125 RepID=A0AAV4PPU0_9ARAC|nr:hypothetical protein CDAR_396771 [Caerostris darwini]
MNIRVVTGKFKARYTNTYRIHCIQRHLICILRNRMRCRIFTSRLPTKNTRDCASWTITAYNALHKGENLTCHIKSASTKSAAHPHRDNACPL